MYHNSLYVDVREVVRSKMIHSIYSFDDRNPDKLKCMENIEHDEKELICDNNYPNVFIYETIFEDNGYSKYRKMTTEHDSRNVTVVSDIEKYMKYCDNRSVIQHNRYVMSKYGVYINVEYCGSVKAIKYIYNYVYMCPDCITCRLKRDKWPVNEIQEYLNGRYIDDIYVN